MIEARGAKYPYAITYIALASRWKGGENTISVSHVHGFLVADSDDEANGKALAINRIVHPAAKGWTYSDFHVTALAGIDWIAAPDLDKIKTFEPPPH